jgi:hypothetical protein
MVQNVTHFFQPFQSKSVKSPVFQCIQQGKEKGDKNLFDPFWDNPASIRPRICLALFFSRPLLNYAAEF